MIFLFLRLVVIWYCFPCWAMLRVYLVPHFSELLVSWMFCATFCMYNIEPFDTKNIRHLMASGRWVWNSSMNKLYALWLKAVKENAKNSSECWAGHNTFNVMVYCELCRSITSKKYHDKMWNFNCWIFGATNKWRIKFRWAIFTRSDLIQIQTLIKITGI